MTAKVCYGTCQSKSSLPSAQSQLVIFHPEIKIKKVICIFKWISVSLMRILGWNVTWTWCRQTDQSESRSSSRTETGTSDETIRNNGHEHTSDRAGMIRHGWHDARAQDTETVKHTAVTHFCRQPAIDTGYNTGLGHFYLNDGHDSAHLLEDYQITDRVIQRSHSQIHGQLVKKLGCIKHHWHIFKSKFFGLGLREHNYSHALLTTSFS